MEEDLHRDLRLRDAKLLALREVDRQRDADAVRRQPDLHLQALVALVDDVEEDPRPDVHGHDREHDLLAVEGELGHGALALEPEREVWLGLVGREHVAGVVRRVRRARWRDEDVEVHLVLDRLAGHEGGADEAVLLRHQHAVRRVECEDAQVLLQHLGVDLPLDGEVVRVVQRQLEHRGHGLDARGHDLRLEVHRGSAEEHPGPQGLGVHHLAQPVALAAAGGHDGELEEVLAEVRRLVGELHLQREVRLHRDLVELGVGLLVVVLGRLHSHAAAPRRPHCGVFVARVSEAADGELVLVHGQRLQRRGVEVALLPLLGLALQEREGELGVGVEVHVEGALHGRGVLERDRLRPHGTERELPELDLVLDELDVGNDGRGRDGEPDGLAAADVEHEHRLKLHGPVEEDVNLHVDARIGVDAAAHGQDRHAVRQALDVEDGRALAVVLDRHGAVRRQAHREDADVEFLFVSLHHEGQIRLRRLARAPQLLVLAVLRLQHQSVLHHRPAARGREDHLAGARAAGPDHAGHRTDSKGRARPGPGEARRRVARVGERHGLRGRAIEVLLAEAEVDLGARLLDHDRRDLSLDEELEGVDAVDLVDQLALEALRDRGADLHVEARRLGRGDHLRDRVGLAELLGVVLHGHQDRLGQVIVDGEGLHALRLDVDGAKVQHLGPRGDEAELPVLQGGRAVAHLRLRGRPRLELLLHQLALVVNESVAGHPTGPVLVVEGPLEVELLGGDVIDGVLRALQA
mmetsp:Transcript_51347/g.135675  ORF Transcript_51347/g.135675 Transcript_51347/m.135675 type:complete len:749 (-) Transcript_51347:1830-4076(-)